MHMLTTLEEILYTAQSDVGSCGYSAFFFKEELGKKNITTFYVTFKASKNKTICTVIMQSKSFKEKICRILKCIQFTNLLLLLASLHPICHQT